MTTEIYLNIDSFPDNHMKGREVAGDDSALGLDPYDHEILPGDIIYYGDVASMTGHSQGGDDTFETLPAADSDTAYAVVLFGDAHTMIGQSIGGNDTFTAHGAPIGSDFPQELGSGFYGDAFKMSGQSQGGDDVMTVDGVYWSALFVGDASEMSGQSQGGDDIMRATGGDGDVGNCTAVFYGDALSMSGQSQGGNDILDLEHESGSGIVYGDAREMSQGAVGGDDLLISGKGYDEMWGDAKIMSNDAAGGADTFRFLQESSYLWPDIIGDFRQEDHDRIDVADYGLSGMGGLYSVTDDGTDTTIYFDEANGVILLGFSDCSLLTDADFIFA